MEKLSYGGVVQELEARGIMPHKQPTLVPTQEGLRRLALDQFDPARVIVVAGTNGKGSVCATLEALLTSAGKKVGLYTSPHLVETTERIRLSGQDISREKFCEVFERVRCKTSDLNLSHFEMLTLMAAWTFFEERPVDYAIFEVGLGGTWDATNAIPHHHCVITHLGMDHENMLGNSLEEIAGNKFGIVSRGAQVVHARLPFESLRLQREVAEKTQSHWKETSAFDLSLEPGKSEPKYWVHTPWGKAAIPLPGRRGAENISLALTAFETLGFNSALHLHALQKTRWPGRMQRFEGVTNRRVYLSGDHNPSGMQSLIELLRDYPRKRLHILVGVGRDKDVNGVLEPLFALPSAFVYLTETPFKGLAISEYGEWLNRAQGAWPNGSEALRKILETSDRDDLILVTGSLYLVGQILANQESFNLAK